MSATKEMGNSLLASRCLLDQRGFSYLEGIVMSCDAPRAVHTIGHSTRALEVFAELLATHRIKRLVDVRRWPVSKRSPHFRREQLALFVENSGIEYIWRADLGGFRKPSPDSPNTGWKVAAFRAYADFMLTGEFGVIMKEMEEQVEGKRTALMCAEAVPWRCHRQLLSDAFLVRGFSVRHILDDGCHEHRLPPFARPQGEKILYPASRQLDLLKG